MTLKLGNNDVSALYLGTAAVDKLYLGTEQIWPATTVFTDDFNRANGALGNGWTALSGVVAPVIVSNAVQAPSGTTDTGANAPGSWNAIQSGALSAVLGADYAEAAVILHGHTSALAILCVYTTDGTHPSYPGFGTIEGPAFQLYHLSGGSAHMISDAPAPALDGLSHRLYGIALAGTDVQFWFDGQLVLVGSISTTAVPRTAKPGITIHHTTTPARLDNYAAWSAPAALPAPTLTSFTPSSAAPGATVNVVGANLVTDATMLLFGESGTARLTVTSPTTGTFVVPDLSEGLRDTNCQTPFGYSTGINFTILPPGPTFGAFTEASSPSAAPHSSMTVALPPGVTGAAHQRVFLMAFIGTVGGAAPAFSPPSGFAAVGALRTDSIIAGLGITLHTQWYQSTTDHSGDANITIGFTGSTYISRLIAGVVNNTMGAVSTPGYATTTGTSQAVPSVTTSVADSTVLLATILDPGMTVATPSGFTLLAATGTDLAYMNEYSTSVAAAGASPTPTVSYTGGTSSVFVALTTGWSAVTTATAPAQVVMISAIGGNAKVTLTWFAPSDGGEPITDYLVEGRTSPAGSWTTFSHAASTATTIEVTGLTNGTAYDFRVSGVNAIGTGTASDPMTATPFLPIPQDGTHPKLWYDFSGSGTTVTDATGNGQNAIMSSDLRDSGQLLIDSAGDFLQYVPTTSPVTKASLTFKFKPSDVAGNCALWTLAIGGDSSGFNLYMQNNHLEFIVRDVNGNIIVWTGSSPTPPTMIDEQTYQVAVTYQSGAMKVYLDGVEIFTSAALTGALNLASASGSGFRVGANPFMSAPNGVYHFDDIRWWDDYCLTSAEVAAFNVHTDDFNRPNASTLGPEWVPTLPDGAQFAISGNKAVPLAAWQDVGYVLPVASGNQYAKVTVTSTGNNHDHASVMIRKPSATSKDGYSAESPVYYGLGRLWQLYKKVGGVDTMLAESVTGTSQTGTHTVEIRAVGSTISMLIDGTQVASVTDTALPSTNRYTGMWCYQESGTLAWDNWKTGVYIPPPPTLVATTTNNNGMASNTVNKPAGGTTGDYYVVWYHEDDRATPPAARVCTGFTTESVMHGVTNIASQWFWKAYSGSEGATFTVTGNTTNWSGAMCYLVRGAPAGWTPNVAPPDGQTTFGQPITASARSYSASTLLLVAYKDYDANVPTGPAGWTQVLHSSSHTAFTQAFTPAGTDGPYTVTPGSGNRPVLLSRLFVTT